MRSIGQVRALHQPISRFHQVKSLASGLRIAAGLGYVAAHRHLAQATPLLVIVHRVSLQIGAHIVRNQPCTVSIDRAMAAGPQSFAHQAAPPTVHHHHLREALYTLGRIHRLL